MECGLYSNDELAKLSENFVCVRSDVGVAGTNEMLKQYGIVGTRGIGPWVQRNNLDFVFFSSNLKPLTHRELKEVTPKPTDESQSSIRWVYTVPGARSRTESAGVVIGAMKKILQLYPPKDKETICIPWQLNADSALHFASYEDRRIVLVPTADGAVSRKLADSLGDPAVLQKHVHNYVFLKVEGNMPDALVDRGRKVGHFRGVAPSQFAFPSETFLQSAAAPPIGLRRLNPGNGLLQSFTKLDSCVEEAFAGHRDVEIQLVSRRTAFEAAIDVPFQIG